MNRSAWRSSLADEIASFPQVCMRNDSRSLLDQWSLSEHDALANEASARPFHDRERRSRPTERALLERDDGPASVRSQSLVRRAVSVTPSMTIPPVRADPQPRTGANRAVVAAFDFDGTLTRGGSVWKFLVFVAGRARVVAAGLLDLPKLVAAAVVGGTANDVAKEALFSRLLAGRDDDRCLEAGGRLRACRTSGVAPVSTSAIASAGTWSRATGRDRLRIARALPRSGCKGARRRRSIATRLEVGG